MASKDEWFEIYASAEPEKSLTKSGAPTHVGGRFHVDPDAAPAMRAGFAQAMHEMRAARDAAQELNNLGGESVNPVVDKYMAAMIDRATGDEGSVRAAADSAIAEYQSVIEQLDAAMAGYTADDESGKQRFEGLS